MSIEIRNLSIKSSVVQRKADDDGGDEGGQCACDEQHVDDDWRAECRRLIVELLDASRER
jgi:hypothetical protein